MALKRAASSVYGRGASRRATSSMSVRRSCGSSMNWPDSSFWLVGDPLQWLSCGFFEYLFLYKQRLLVALVGIGLAIQLSQPLQLLRDFRLKPAIRRTVPVDS